MDKTTMPVLTICTSTSFYANIVALSYKLEALGLTVVMPKAADKMKRGGKEKAEAIAALANGPFSDREKGVLMRAHFDEITVSDAILVGNYTKHGKPNYIGPNVLLEMGIAFYLRKPIYVLNDVPSESPLLDEILGFGPVLLKGNLAGLKRIIGKPRD